MPISFVFLGMPAIVSFVATDQPSDMVALPWQAIEILTNATGMEIGGAEGDRTPDLRIANAALSQLSYGPMGGADYVRRGWTMSSAAEPRAGGP